MKNQEKPTFEYMGHHFIPYANIQKGLILDYMHSNDELGFAQHLGYSHSNFYKASGNSKSDLFKCIENNRIYIPCSDRLYEYSGRI